MTATIESNNQSPDEMMVVHDPLTGQWHRLPMPPAHSALHLDPLVAVILDKGLRNRNKGRKE